MATSSSMHIPMWIAFFYYNGICIASYRNKDITIGKGKGTILRIVKDGKIEDIYRLDFKIYPLCCYQII